MATIVTASRSAPAAGQAAVEKPLAEFLAFWRAFFAKAFNPYRPELHYMRGPGPAWRAIAIPWKREDLGKICCR